MAWLFNLCYLALLTAASPWLLSSAVFKGKYREGWGERLLGLVPRRDSQRRCVWLHAVSLGEVNLLQTLLERIEQEYPDWDVVISSTTATGYQQAKQKYSPRTIFYAPLDFSWAVRAALSRLRPDVLILAELELWPNLLRAAKRQGVQVAVINGRLGEKSFRGYQRLRWLLSSTFGRLDLVAAQSDEYAERFTALGCTADRVRLTGSLKFDGATADRQNVVTQRLARLAGFGADDVVFLAGSTQEPEELLALDVFEAYATTFPQLILVLVPRHPERFAEVAATLDRRGVKWQRRSVLQDAAAGLSKVAAGLPTEPPRILLVDVVGELGAWWGTAQIAFVGGSLGNRGGQNMIEPAAYGAAVCFGPNTWNFKDVVELLLRGEAAVVVRSVSELQHFVGQCLTDPPFAQSLGQRAALLVQQQQGATDLTMQSLRRLFDPPSRLFRRIDSQSPSSRPATRATKPTKRAG
jgi:3-deoxy-D-manno-octulosonic-acid transferase